MMPALRLAGRMLLRDARAGELWLLFIALVIAVGSLTSVGFFSERLARAINREANQVLGGDLLVSGDYPIPQGFADEAAARGLARNESMSFTSMASAAGVSQLAGVKAVEPGYPLRGSLRVARGLNLPDQATRDIPPPGAVWLDERLASALSVKVGDKVNLGRGQFTVAAILTYEPDRGVNFFAIVPRLMMNAADLAATGLIQVGSRVSYRLHLAGGLREIEAYRDWLKPRLMRGQVIEDVSSARPELRNAIDRAERFLKLAALLAVVLAAVAIGLSARRFIERHLNGCAVMRCLGAQSRQLLGLFALEFLMLGLFACALGVALGFGIQFLLAGLVQNLLEAELPAPGLAPLLQGVGVMFVLLAGFVAPYLVRLARVSPLAVMRREWAGSRVMASLTWAVGAVALAALLFWIAGDVVLGAQVVGGFGAALAVFALASWGLIRLAGSLRRFAGVGERFGLSSVNARLGLSLVQAVSLALGIMALALLVVTRSDLLRNWANSVPADAPNRFVINIQPDQKKPVEDFLRESGVRAELKPMVRARLTAINGKPVDGGQFFDERARRLVEREFNLSHDAALPYGNRVVGGRWHGEDRAPQFSVEDGLAKTLGLRLGDTLRFEVAGRAVEAKITSLRALRWDSMRVNFFVIAPSGALADMPESFITAFHVGPDQTRVPDELVARFPNLTVVDVAAILAQFKRVMDQLSRAVECVFVFSLLAGLLVLAAALASTHDERRQELAVLRTLGARNRVLWRAVLAEFSVLALAAGGLGVAAAAGVGFMLARFVFKLAYEPDVWAMGLAFVLFAGGVVLVGLLGTRGAMRASVQEALGLSA